MTFDSLMLKEYCALKLKLFI